MLDAVAGLLGVAVALGVGEFAAGVVRGPSLLFAMGDVVVDYTPGAVVKAGIEALGTNDKPAILLAVTIGSMAIGVLLGPAAGKRPHVGTAVFAGLGLIGAAAAARDPLTSTVVAVLVASVAAGSGLAALRVLLRAATPAVPEEHRQMPGRGIADRRRFLAFAAGAVGISTVSAFAGRRVIGPAVNVEDQRRSVVLPPIAGPVASSGSGLQVPGLSPLITPNKSFYRIDTALLVPRVDAQAWRLGVTGMVDYPYELTFAELLAMRAIEEPVTLACVSNEVGGDLVGNAIWRGIPLTDILARAGVQRGATQIVGRSVDGFTVGFPTDVALDGRLSMVAVGMNGEPLPAAHGFPARLIVPGLYGYVSATKWLTRIELTTLEEFDAYWIPRGWDKQAPIKTQSRIDVPGNGKTVASGHLAVAGVAWGGNRGVAAVEVRIRHRNADMTEAAWTTAKLGDALSASTWRQWVVDWDAEVGDYQIQVRATDGRGETQTAMEKSPGPNGATGYHGINVRVQGA